MTNKVLDKQYLLNVPMAFVLQDKSINEVESFFDDYGWNIFHHAVAQANIEKIKELLHFSFNPTINSKKNFIPANTYSINEKKKEQALSIPNKISFYSNGFSAIHLTLFLYNYYSTVSDDFFYRNIADKYQQILHLLVNEETSLTSCLDASGYSLFDYAFLLENITLIDYMHMLDFNLSSLNKVKLETAKKILEVISIKKNDKKHKHLIGILDKNILNQNLEKNLRKKNNNDIPILKI